VGHLDPPYDRLLQESNTGSVIAHGWIDSTSDRYLRLLRSCRFAYLPTWIEGQMGTLLEALAAGCIPITTCASGIDEAVLRHCVVIEPRNPAQHREAIRWVLTWSPAECDTRRRRLRQTAQAHHTWTVFTDQVNAAVAPLLVGGADSPARRRT
jgi:glycosyltransferase involved in cell wall biosynthesis